MVKKVWERVCFSMEKSFESQRELHQLLDDGLDAVTTSNGRAAGSVFVEIEKRFDNISAPTSKKGDKVHFLEQPKT